MTSWYIYNNNGENVAVVTAKDLIGACLEFRSLGFNHEDYSIERA